MFNINRYIKKLACSVFAASAAVLQIKHLSAKKFSNRDNVIVYNIITMWQLGQGFPLKIYL